MTDNKLILPEGFSLYPFQVDTIHKQLEFLNSPIKGCFCANEQGLGKSVTSVVTANTFKQFPVVVICPAVMRRVWVAEINSLTRLSPASVPSIKLIEASADILSPDGTSDTNAYNWIITSYNLLLNKEVLSYILSHSPKLFIADEAHYLSSYKSQRTKLFQTSLNTTIPYKMFLSGTPFRTNVVDTYNCFQMLLPSERSFENFFVFAASYSYQKPTRWGTNYYGLKNADKLSQIIRSNFFIRYKKADVLKDLPDKVYQDIILSPEYCVDKKTGLTEAELAEAHAAQLKALDAVISSQAPSIPAKSPALAKLSKLQGLQKVKPVAEFARDLLEQGIAVSIFAWHKEVIAGLENELSEFNPAVITGETSAKDRAKAVEDVQNKKIILFIGNIIAAGVGITLTAISNVLLAELPWTPSDVAQAIDRHHRIGTKDTVFIYNFIVPDSLDEAKCRVIMRRAKEVNKLFDK